MKRLISALILVILLLMPVSCAPAATFPQVEGGITPAEEREKPTLTEEREEPTLTEEQQELWVERGILLVSTIEEASRLVGYQVAVPTFIPEGFLPGGLQLNQLGPPPQAGGEWGDGSRVAQQVWNWSSEREIRFFVMQFQGTLENVQGVPSEVCGDSGRREFFVNREGSEYPLLWLHRWDGERVYSVGGILGGPLTEEILYKIACSVGVE